MDGGLGFPVAACAQPGQANCSKPSRTHAALVSAEASRQVYNVRINAEPIAAGGGHVEALEVDWTHGLQDPAPRFDIVIGSDILYEPHLFEDLLDVMQQAAPQAVLVQNVARKGTEYFKDLCRNRNIGLRAVDVSAIDANEQWITEGVADAVDGVYECWFLDFSQARGRENGAPSFSGAS